MEKDFKQIFLPLSSVLQDLMIKKDKILINIIDKWDTIIEKFGPSFLATAKPTKIFWNGDKAVLYIKLKDNYLAVMIMQQVNKLIDIINKEIGANLIVKIILLNK